MDEGAEENGEVLVENNVPIFSNSVIRAELLELKRRVLITEALVDLSTLLGSLIPREIFNAIKALKERIRVRENQNKHYFLGVREIKEFKKQFDNEWGRDRWEGFCKSYLATKLQSEWDNQVASKHVSYISGDDKSFLTDEVSWDKMIDIVEEFGIGTADAMIINIFLTSTFSFIATADSDVAACMSQIDTPKVCVVPQGLNY